MERSWSSSRSLGFSQQGFGAGDELVGHAGAGRYHDDNLVANVVRGLDALGDFVDAFDVTHGGAAKFFGRCETWKKGGPNYRMTKTENVDWQRYSAKVPDAQEQGFFEHALEFR